MLITDYKDSPLSSTDSLLSDNLHHSGAPGTTSTPHSLSLLRAFVLSRRLLEYTLFIPATLRYHAAELHQRFASQFPSRTNEFVLDREPSSIPEPLYWFLSS